MIIKEKPRTTVKAIKGTQLPELEKADLSVIEGLHSQINVKNIKTNHIVRYEFKNRNPEEFGDMDALKSSIKEVGILKPIIVFDTEDGYILIAGERRWTASKELNLKTVQAKVYPEEMFSDAFALRLQEIENEESEGMTDYGKFKHYRNLLENDIYASRGDLIDKLNIKGGRQELSRMFSFEALEAYDNLINCFNISSRRADDIKKKIFNKLGSKLDKFVKDNYLGIQGELSIFKLEEVAKKYIGQNSKKQKKQSFHYDIKTKSGSKAISSSLNNQNISLKLSESIKNSYLLTENDLKEISNLAWKYISKKIPND
ncbi:ParB/RepB/Spo0J family partition protein [Piscirickettsia litoralis]|uniref:ParB-like N-terminal domain-containing protein n=1 Tax=Piscirickettsia litoralis TaxID=1891921 RepID=A0ABX3A171_9GAMM|nr:ParB/RepB/Spo0J family partition protein [Piscirickettsia litoralis]ODN41150.1 hypothetical protein BGC07_17910 [Piscirickettsia litoralis]